jgi:hypothetical protein
MQASVRRRRVIFTPAHHHRRCGEAKRAPPKGRVGGGFHRCAVTAKQQWRQLSPLLVDLASFLEIAPGVVARPADQGPDRVVTRLSSQRGYPAHATRQDSIPGTGMWVLTPAWMWVGSAAENWIDSLEGSPGLSYPPRSPCLPTYLPHRQTVRHLPGLSA